MKKLNVCMISGSFEYDSEESLQIFQNYLVENYPQIKTTLIIYQDEDNNPSLEVLETTDVVVVFTRRLRIEGENLERFKAYSQAGRPIIGIRTASHAYQNWLEFDAEVLGGSYQGHFGHGPRCHVEIIGGQENHPILESIPNFDAFGSLYKNSANAEDVTVLMNAKTSEGNQEPVTWVRRHNGGRVFYTSLGHQDDFRLEGFLRLLANALFWVTE